MERIGSLYARELGRRGTKDIAATCYPETMAIRIGLVGYEPMFMIQYQSVRWSLKRYPQSVQGGSASAAHAAAPPLPDLRRSAAALVCAPAALISIIARADTELAAIDMRAIPWRYTLRYGMGYGQSPLVKHQASPK